MKTDRKIDIFTCDAENCTCIINTLPLVLFFLFRISIDGKLKPKPRLIRFIFKSKTTYNVYNESLINDVLM